MKYQDYLASERWQTLRAKALERDGRSCQTCGHKKSLHVHHRRYPKRLGHEPLTYLITLCKDCHEAIHEALKRAGRKIPGDWSSKPAKASKPERLTKWQEILLKVPTDDEFWLPPKDDGKLFRYKDFREFFKSPLKGLRLFTRRKVGRRWYYMITDEGLAERKYLKSRH